MPDKKSVKYDVSPDAVVQLGGSLYKNVYGILVEYITNSYDADATRVEISINRNENTITIKDNGIGMSRDELEKSFMSVGKNRRRNADLCTAKNRLVTGRKGLGKLAFFGLFSEFKIETVQKGQKSTLTIRARASRKKDGSEIDFAAHIDKKSAATDESDNTVITLSNLVDETNLPSDKILSESLAKRINLMYYDKSKGDEFYIMVNRIKIDKKYRDNLILNSDVKFKYEIRKQIGKFNLKKEVEKYFYDKDIHGYIIARESTVKIKENKGIVLFARGKLCQEATYLDINPANNYAYAHLYGELHVDFIDNDKKDHIGTDRTALKDTILTKELLNNVQDLMRAYAALYDKEQKKKAKKDKKDVKAKIQQSASYKKAKKIINNYRDALIRKKANALLSAMLDKSIEQKASKLLDANRLLVILYSLSPQTVFSVKERGSKDTKETILQAHDRLVLHVQEKYNYKEEDGLSLFERIYQGDKEGKNRLARVKIALPRSKKSKSSLVTMMTGYGKVISGSRNIVSHNTDRKCIDESIAQENVNRFINMVDLIIELDDMCFEPTDD